jgi:capsular polysaccharide transport system permease protein
MARSMPEGPGLAGLDMTSLVDFRNQLGRGLQRQGQVVFALLFKEFRTRSASSTGRLAIFWTVVTPIVSASILAWMWSFLGRKEFYGVSTFLVMSVSIIPYFLVRNGFNSIPAAIWQNSGLYGYPMVKPIDAVLARYVLDITLTSIAGIVMLLALYWFAGITPQLYYPLEALGIYALTLVMVLGISLIVGVYSTISDGFRRVVGFLTRPLIMVSLVIHLGSGLPQPLRPHEPGRS